MIHELFEVTIMRKLLLLLFVPFLIYAQDTDSVSTEVKEVWEILRKHSIEKNKRTVQRTKEELNLLAKKLYYANEKDPYGFQSHLSLLSKEFMKTYKYGQPYTTPAGELFKLEAEIDSTYGYNYSAVSKIPFYLRITVLNRDSSVTYTYENNVRQRSAITARIEEVIKGKKHLKEGDTLNLVYSGEWFQSSQEWPKIRVGLEYFVALCVYPGIKYPFVTGYNLEEPAFFLIKNNIIQDPPNYFGFGKELSWSEFKRYFIEKYMWGNEK